MKKSFFRAFLGLSALVSLTACATSEEAGPARRCPQVAIIRELERVADYGANQPTPSERVAMAAMQRVEGRCRYTDKGVDVTFDLHLAAMKGPRLGGGRVSFPFFVSLVDPQDAILAKEMLTATFSFAQGEDVTNQQEPLHIFIPLADKTASAAAYRVLMGFQMTEDQVKALRGASK